MSACVKCGENFHCAMADGDTGEACWCTTLPPIPTTVLTEAVGENNACFCPHCLKRVAHEAGIDSL